MNFKLPQELEWMKTGEMATEGKEGVEEEEEEKEDPCRFVYRKFLGEWNKLNYEVARFKGGVPLVFSTLW